MLDIPKTEIPLIILILCGAIILILLIAKQ